MELEGKLTIPWWGDMLNTSPKESQIISIKEKKSEKQEERLKDQMKSPVRDLFLCLHHQINLI